MNFTEPSGPFNLGSVTDKVLQNAARRLQEIDINAGVAGLATWQPLSSTHFDVLGAEIIQRGLARAAKASPGAWRERVAGLELAMSVQAMNIAAGSLADAIPQLLTQALRAVDEVASLGGVPDMNRLEGMEVVRTIAAFDVQQATSAGLPARVATWITKSQTAAQTELSRSWTTADLTLARNVLELQLLVSSWMSGFPSVEPSVALAPKTLLPLLTQRITAIPVDAKTGRKIADMIQALTQRARELSQPPPPPAFVTNGSGGDAPPSPPPSNGLDVTDLLAAASALAQHGAGGIEDLLAWLRSLPELPGGLQIPGDVRLERVGGAVTYDRSRGFLEGTFLGRLEIPSAGFFAEVTQASINTNGEYTLNLAGGVTLPVVDGNNLRFELGSLMAQGTAGGQFSLSGGGSIILMNGPGGTAGSEFAVTMAYDSQQQRLQASSAASQITLPFTDDVALLNGTVALDVGAQGPAAMQISGSLGLIARGTPAAAPVPDDFQLVAEIENARLEFDGDTFTTTLTGGTLKLPPGLFGDSTERVSAVITSPLIVSANRLTGELSVDFNELTVELELPGGSMVQAGISYDHVTRVLRLEGATNQLDLAISDHLAALATNFVLELGGVGPGTLPSGGMIELGGTFGLLRHEKPPQTPGSHHVNDYHLALENGLVRLAFQPGSFTATLVQGSLLLPEMFSSGTDRARVAVDAMSPPQMQFTFAPTAVGMPPELGTITLQGAVAFQHLGLVIPGFSMVGAREFAGGVDFGGITVAATGAVLAASAPKLTIDTGFVFFPHPVDQSRVEIEAVDFVWKLDGFPVGTLGLATDVSLFNGGGFELSMLGAPGAQTTGIEILAPSGGATLPSLRIFGQMRLLFDNTLLTRDATNPAIQGIPTGRFGSLAAGELTIHAPLGNALPQVDFALSDVSITGDFRIGGASGVRVTGLTAGTPASIMLSGLGNLFNLADVPGQQFIVTLNGKVVKRGCLVLVLAMRSSSSSVPLSRHTSSLTRSCMTAALGRWPSSSLWNYAKLSCAS